MSTTNLETAVGNQPLKRVVIDPVTRVEGHGKVTLLLDEDNRVQQARLHIVEFRGFEKFIQGRPYWEVPIVVQRLCGICPVSHQLAAGKAIDQIVGAQLSPAATKLRRLLHWGQVLQSHALHFFHLASPDLLFGFDSEVQKRNIFGVIAEHPTVALEGVQIRRYGQEIIKAISGKKIHGVVVMPGGMNKAMKPEEVKTLAAGIGEIVGFCVKAVALAKRLYQEHRNRHEAFGRIESPFLGLIGPDGELELYDGGIRVKEADGSRFVDQYPCNDYMHLVREQVKNWSYMKFPYLIDKGPEYGWYRVGPLARLNNCDRITTPLAEAERVGFLAAHQGLPQGALAYHWARMIEALHCAEAIREMLGDPDLMSDDLVRTGERHFEGIGVIEAPRGTLFHHYEVNDEGLVTRANLIVSTTSNNQAMNESIRRVAIDRLNGANLTPELLNEIEVAIRAYDPCLSCATHAVGRMPLVVELEAADGTRVGAISRDEAGTIAIG
ncbi:MAG: Ni/Fe hydrogenase subunit alpha [Gammaproteobacteria bacterium]|nr:Ni/Fe hydrogenase subunit alpha [Gammaproteobacteria bacterium]